MTERSNTDTTTPSWPSETNRSRLRSHWDNEYRYSRLELADLFSKEEATERRLHLLPALASTLLVEGDCAQAHNHTAAGTWNDLALRTLLLGTRDDESVLGRLDYDLVRLAYSFVVPELSNRVVRTVPAHCLGTVSEEIIKFSGGRPSSYEDARSYEFVENSPKTCEGVVSFVRCGTVEFPPPENRNVNMMPFIIGDVESLPDDLRCYYPLVETCPYDDEEMGKVGYLTVHETYVNENDAQRRQGLHIEAPGIVLDDDNECLFCPAKEHHWGMGVFYGQDRFLGGIYFASNVEGTSRVYDALVKNVPGIVDGHGGCERLREFVGPGTNLRANELVWMTDRTPHEALPQKESGYRQFFRVVTSRVSHWFADHSTPNPKVPLPEGVVAVRGNKFSSLKRRDADTSVRKRAVPTA